ncbi:MAG TPA: AGE family epimerase/isomerase [Tianweitania sediminis]|jgi:mannose-6-phosphate isomerase|nr:AGE family epimerase/isomerase [Tianweitania sediminis]
MFSFMFGRSGRRAEASLQPQPLPPEADLGPALCSAADDLRKHLFEEILPLWSTVGLDHARGGYVEALPPVGAAKRGPRRVRVTARQVYSFCEAAQLGWNRAAAVACVRHGHRFLLTNSGPDGLLYNLLDEDNDVQESGYQLVDQAFLLLAYARAYHLLGDEDIALRARRLHQVIVSQFSHGDDGYRDGSNQPFPLRSTPHMHLLEAALSWIALSPDTIWTKLAEDMVALLKSRLLDPETALVFSAFDPQWRPLKEGRMHRFEPGLTFEWAWLMMRWEELTGGDTAGYPDRMVQAAERLGHDVERNVTVNAIWSNGAVSDAAARLWPQTERLKAWLALSDRHFGREAWTAEKRALEAAASVQAYVANHANGLWRDTMLNDGSFLPGEAPASSLYHIICAIGEFTRYARRRRESLPFLSFAEAEPA